jgi:sugar lactone lactonase YvrE
MLNRYLPVSLAAVLLAALSARAQGVGIGTAGAPAASAALEVASTTQGLLPPRLTAAQRAAIASPAPGLQVFQTDGTIGLYYYTGVAWVNLTNGRVPDANGSTVPANGGTINTLAGTGRSNYGGDGGPATSAQFSGPIGVAVDAGGTVYVADWDNSRIRAISPAGIISTVAGTGTRGAGGDGGPATSAQLYLPGGVAVAADGTLYVGDQQNHRVRAISPAGIMSTLAGTGTPGFSGDGGPATAAQLNLPTGVAVDAGGTVYVADQSNHRVRAISPTGSIRTVAGTGTAGYGGDGGPAASAQLSSPYGVAVDAGGTLYVADRGNYCIRAISPAGIISTVAGTGTPGFSGDGGPATSAQLNQPTGVAVDAGGTLYVGDRGNQRVRAISPAGIIRTVAGTGTAGYGGDGGPATSAQLRTPIGLAVDAGGTVYVADQSNNRVRVIK